MASARDFCLRLCLGLFSTFVGDGCAFLGDNLKVTAGFRIALLNGSGRVNICGLAGLLCRGFPFSDCLLGSDARLLFSPLCRLLLLRRLGARRG